MYKIHFYKDKKGYSQVKEYRQFNRKELQDFIERSVEL